MAQQPSSSSSGSACIPALRMQDFNYTLPDERIAIYPAAPRGSSRLMVVKLGKEQHVTEDSSFPELARHLPPNSHMVFNESLVFSARVFATHSSAAERFEVLFLNPETPFNDPAEALRAAHAGQVWRCMVRKHFDAPGAVLRLLDPSGSDGTITLEILKIHIEWNEHGEEPGIEADIRIVSGPDTSAPPSSLSAVLTRCGETPLPPYLNRDAEASDKDAYQNVYASEQAQGSVAAPTAGLHFTQALLDQLQAAGTTSSSLALHVSAATFKPVTTDAIAEHEMHKESFEVNVAQLQGLLAAMQAGKQVVSVGTTSTRLLETLYWLGVKEHLAPASAPPSDLDLDQWEAYHLGALGPKLPCTPVESYQALLRRAASSGASRMFGFTSLCIVPGYTFAVVNAQVTNFHQPDSTLLLLVAAFIGDTSGRKLVEMYNHAVESKYRFLSYGDACLFTKAQ